MNPTTQVLNLANPGEPITYFRPGVALGFAT